MAKERKHESTAEVIYKTNEQVDEHILRELAENAFSLDGFSLAELGEARPLAYIEDSLKEEIIGQPAAIESLVNALYRDELRNPDRPIAVLMFMGPTGVGKTETAKALSLLLHGRDDAILKINCSEISQDQRVSALIGATPEYVGREQPPMFDKKKIEQPKSIILFDEIEKGADALRDLLLQICEDGEVTLLNGGHKVSFKNSIIILTSNLGAEQMMQLLKPVQLGFQSQTKERSSSKQIEEAATKALEKSGKFKPELLNRIDEKIVFNPLTDEQMGQILDRYVRKLSELYVAEKGIHLTLTPELRDELVKSCDHGPEDRGMYGARPILRKYDRFVGSLLGRMVSSEGIKEGSRVLAKLADDMPESTPLPDRVRLYQKPDASLLGRLIKKSEMKAIERKKEASSSTATNSQMAIGAAAIAGIAALIVGDYFSSRRSIRKFAR